jgi:hypothetical protein
VCRCKCKTGDMIRKDTMTQLYSGHNLHIFHSLLLFSFTFNHVFSYLLRYPFRYTRHFCCHKIIFYLQRTSLKLSMIKRFSIFIIIRQVQNLSFFFVIHLNFLTKQEQYSLKKKVVVFENKLITIWQIVKELLLFILLYYNTVRH